MPTKSEMFPPKYVNTQLIRDIGGTHAGAIRQILTEEIRNPQGISETKYVMYLVGLHQGLILNITNAELLTDITGKANSDNWPGQWVELYVDESVKHVNSDKRGGVRVRATEGTPTVPDSQPELEREPISVGYESDRGYATE